MGVAASENYIDELVNDKLKQIQYLPSDTRTDSEFLRRVCLDVIGILPTVAESRCSWRTPRLISQS